MKKKVVSLTLVLCMLLSFMPIIASAATSGTCGSNLTWTLDDNGTLTISGTGEMDNWDIYDTLTPWYSNCDSIKNVIIENSVTSIGEDAFSGCRSLTSITIPNSVTSIGDSTFFYCSSLTSITIPNSVTSIGYGAFEGCISLTSITIPNSVTSIGDNAFLKCRSLASITIPNSVTSIGEDAFSGCRSLTSITIPNSVTSIGDNAFLECRSLASITIPKGVTSISPGAFRYCSSLENIKADEKNRYYSSIDGNLYNRDKTELVKYAIGKGDKTFNIPNSVTSIGYGAFEGCSSLTSITIPNSVTSIGYGAFDDCRSLENISVDKNNQQYSSEDGILFNKAKSILIRYAINKSDTQYIMPNSVTSIDDGAFGGCSSLINITISNSVINIGSMAFDGCSSLISMIIPDSITSIGDWAFGDCSSLTSVTIPNSVTSIGDGTFDGCSSLTSITIPNSVTSIGEDAFDDCSSLTSIIIPNSVTSIGDGAFDGCSSLISMIIPDSVTSIGDWAFGGCSSLTSVTIPNSVTSIGKFAFWHCSSLTSITIPNSVTSIGYGAFEGCSSLTSITIPNSVTSIGDWAFEGCSSLTSITIPNSVTSIGIWAFKSCSSLTSIAIPNSITSICYCAFSYCSSLTDVYYGGSEERWNSINISVNNYYLTDATIHYNSSGIPTGTKGNTNSTSDGAPIIKSVYVKDSGNNYNIMNTAVNMQEDSTVSVDLSVDVDWNGNENGKIYITQGTKTSIEVPNGKLTFKPGEELSAGKTVYILAIDEANGKSTSTQVKLKVNAKNGAEWNPSTGTNNFNFKLGQNVGFTIPDSVVFPFGGMEIGFGLDFIPITFEYENENKINIAFGIDSSNIDKTTGRFKDFSFADYKSTLKKNMKKGRDGYTVAKSNEKLVNGLKKKYPNMKFDKVKFSVSKDMGWDADVTGYAEMSYFDGGWHFNEGFLAFNAEFSYEYQGQVFIWVVPCYYEFGGKVGGGIEGTLKDIQIDGFKPTLEGYISGKVGASIGGGIGVAKVCTVGASGSGSLNIKYALHRDYVKSWGEGDANINVKVVGKTVAEKNFAHGEFTIYETGNKNALIKDKNAITLQSEDEMYDSIDIDSIYPNESRAYAENSTEWLGDKPQINLMDVDYTNKELNKVADNIYTECAPQICEIDGKKVMVIQWDNSNRADVDRTMLVYSVYDDEKGTWSAPKAVDDDGTADFYPCFKDGYLVWQNEKSTLTDDMTLTEIDQKAEICVAKWNGNGFDAPTAITDNNTLDTQPSVTAESGTVHVVWTTNTKDDIMGISGTNAIMQSDFDGTSWSKPTTVKSGLNAITNISTGIADGTFGIAYVADDDNDFATINDRDIKIIANGKEEQLTDNDVLDSNPVFANDMIYYYSGGNIAYSDLHGTNVKTVFDEPKAGLTDSFVVDSNKKGDTAIWWTKTLDNSTEVYSSLYKDGEWSDEIQVTSVGNIAKYPSGILNDDGTMLVAFNNGIAENNQIVKTDLYTISVMPSYDIALSDAEFDEDNMTAYATVTNKGELPIESYKVAISGNNEKTVSEPLKAGESAEIEIEYKKPSDFSKRNVELSVSIENVDEYNLTNNSATLSIGNADITVENVAVNEDETIVSANVSNIGYADAKNVKVQLRDGSADGSVIEEKSFDIAVGASKNVQFNIDKSSMKFFDAQKQLYVTAEYDGDEISKGNNDGYVFISSGSGVADYETEILNYNKNSEGKYVINSVARNNTDKTVSCVLYSAVYSSDGTLKSCGTVKADIKANTDTGVDITLPCEIETGDTIKTFMWDKNMLPLAKNAEVDI